MLTQTTIRHSVFYLEPKSTSGVSVHAVKADDEPLAQTMNLIGAVMSHSRNSEIFGEGEPADYLYKVMSGCARTYKTLNDGRRQMNGFYLTGEVLGLSFEDEYTESAEAIADSKVLVIKRSAVDALARRNPAIARELLTLTGRELRRAQDRVLLLIKIAQERVAGFLVEMAERMSAGDAIELPMSRQDIAHYLGLSIATVSRTLTALECLGLIEMPTSRHIELRNRQLLRRVSVGEPLPQTKAKRFRTTGRIFSTLAA
jgi:CRP/FNR family transcriptional regulator, nitrogen fixation regulation protein